MLFELSLYPIGSSRHTSRELAEVVKVIETSGLPYRLTPSSTCIEGEWDEVMEVVKQCHQTLRERAPYVVTTLKIEDDSDGGLRLDRNVEVVREKMETATSARPR